MKMTQKINNVQSTIDPSKSKKMEIRKEDMNIALSIFRKRIYSNPISAIIREVSTNARDAHVEVGKKNTPIEIKLPDRNDPNFYIRDFGPGIDEDRMWNIFANYAASTKRETNDQVGCFGIGSKSPFSYSDSFTVKSITPNETGKLICRQYMAIMKNEDGYIEKVFERDASLEEQQGTTIYVPVEQKDFDEFRVQVEKTLQFWNPKPKVISRNRNFVWPQYTWDETSKTNRWAICTISYGDRSKISDNTTIVDGICYPLDLITIRQKSKKEKTKKIIDKIQNSNRLSLFFETGEISLTASREDLDYSAENTISSIEKSLDLFVKEIKNQIESKIKDAEDLWQANVQLSKFSKYSRFIDNIKWKDKDVLGKFEPSKYLEGITYKLYDPCYDSINKSFKITEQSSYNKRYAFSFFTYDDSLTYKLIIDDIGNKVVHRNRINTLMPGNLYVIKIDPADAKNVCDKLKDFSPVLLSTVEPTKIISSGNKSGFKHSTSKDGVFKVKDLKTHPGSYSYGGRTYSSLNWIEINFKEDKVIYTEQNNNRVCFPGKDDSISDISLNHIKKLIATSDKYKDYKFICLTRKLKRHMGENFEKCQHVLQDCIDEIYKKTEIDGYVHLSGEYNPILDSTLYKYLENNKNVLNNELITNCKILAQPKDYWNQNYQVNNTVYLAIDQVKRIIDLDESKLKFIDIVSEARKYLKKNFPLFLFLKFYDPKSDKEQEQYVIEYVLNRLPKQKGKK